jgi:hypothetical protein
MPNTYTELLKTTVGTATPSVTLDLTGISGYTDLVVVYVATASTGNPDMTCQINGDTGSNYSATRLSGNGTAASSARYTSQTFCRFDEFAAPTTTAATTGIISVMNYSNATTYKTLISRSNQAGLGVEAFVNLWRSTAAITSLAFALTSGNIAVGSTFSLYGIANADQGAAKATGGIITEDSQYWYHTFGATSAFVPKQSLSCDILQVAGGGGGGGAQFEGGGGGAGGVLAFASQTISTSQNITVGGGGAGGANASRGTNGSNSQFASLTASVGGGSGGNRNSVNGNSGGSGGGGTFSGGTGGSATSGQGNAGGSYAGGGGEGAGGGGAGGTGSNNTPNVKAGDGGAGVSTVTNWGSLSAIATVNGLGVSGFIAGGGGGGANGAGNGIGTGGSGGGGNGNVVGAGVNAVAFTGSGGGGAGGSTSAVGGNGASGLVIVRYAK